MALYSFIKKHKEKLKKIISAVGICLLMAVFIVAFSKGWLPDSSKGDAFDTIYAYESTN